MAKFNFKLFKEICETRAISGDEKDLVSYLKKHYLKSDAKAFIHKFIRSFRSK